MAVSDWEIGRRDELPEGWAEATLEEIAIHVLGGEWGDAPEDVDRDPELVRVRVVRGTEFRDWYHAKGSTAAARAIKSTSLAKRRLAAGDLVVEVSGGGAGQPVGRTLLIDEESLARADAPLVCANFCRQLRIHPEIDPGWVHLALQHLYLSGAFDEHQTQTTNIRNLNFPGFVAGVVIPVPPLAEQRRIVARAREMQAKALRSLEATARVLEILRRLRLSALAAAYSGRLTEDWRAKHSGLEPLQALLPGIFAARREQYRRACDDAEAFDRRAPRRPKNLASTDWEAPEPLEPPEVPEGWSVLALQDLIRRAQYGLSEKADRDAKTGIPMLRMGNIQDGAMDVSDLKYVRLKGADAENYRVRRGDILFNRTNSPELVGKAAVYDADLEAVFASYLVRIECDERLVASRYVCGWINSPWGRRWARTVRTDCVSQSNINVSRLLTMPVPAPPLAEQEEIVRRLDDVFAFAAEVERLVAMAGERAQKLWRTILARAMRGELVPTEAELARGEGRGFEPAADILDRIGAERLARGGAEGEVSAEDGISAVILAAVRQVCWGAGALPREELMGRVAARLGRVKLGKSVRARLEKHIEIALSRRILAREGDLLAGATPTFGRYDYAFLVHTAQALLRGGEWEQGELIRAVASHLGFSQVTFAIRARMDRVFQWAVQNGMLEIEDGRVRRGG
ncbi:MAG TPA: restriction endonuclease subunit S [Thermoanaerobaculia bacterium]|nr:restriction endonuclease subunit S [Thermoanaerobaculia bacterium]